MASNEEILAMIESLKTQIKMLETAFKTSMKGARKSKKEKEVDSDGNPIEKVKRPLNAWQAWTHHVLTEYKEEYDAFAAEQESRRGVAIKFAKHCQEAKAEEYEDFKTSFVPAVPTESEPSEKKEKKTKKTKPVKAESDSDSDSDSEKKTKKPVKKAEKAEKPKKEEKPVKKAEKKSEKKAEKKAVGGAGAPNCAAHSVVEMAPPSDSDSDDDALTVKKWVFRGKTYFRSGDNDCWIANSDGSMGSWAGKYDPIADSIDETADEPEHD
jgi:DNA polymerase III alpha subunit (gram-positive type)